ASQANTFQRDGKNFEINMFGVVVDLDTECNGQPCIYAEREPEFSYNFKSPEAIFDDSPSWQDYDDDYYCLAGEEPV
ncbi:hypothetical protein BGX24_004599, partial [Mortierella sp. AD032]